MLVVFGGLPGTGKTTLATALALRQRASYVRVDAIESALVTSKWSAPIVSGIADRSSNGSPISRIGRYRTGRR